MDTMQKHMRLLCMNMQPTVSWPLFAEERWLFVKEEEHEAALTEEILATAAAAREQPAGTPGTVPGHAPSTLFKFVFLAFHAFSMFF